MDGPPWPVPGSTTQIVTRATVTIDGLHDDLIIPVWRVIEAGQWEMDFYRENGSGETSGYFDVTDTGPYEGLLLQRRDIYGNAHTYKYTIYSNPTVARVTQIRINGDLDEATFPEADISFFWDSKTSSANQGRLKEVKVARYNGEEGTTVPVVTQHIIYTYMDDTDTDLSDDLGTTGDLVQVTRLVRIDPDSGFFGEAWRPLITQYRYHRDDGNESGSVGEMGSERFIWAGDEHQLKMVILPEQIEYFAQGDTTGNTDDVEEAATHLLSQDDGATFSDGMDTYYVADLAAKVIEEYEASPGRVLVQHIQSACGCGGSGTQGKRKSYTYWDRDGSLPGATTIRCVEESLGASGFDDYRTYFYEMEKLGDEDVPYVQIIAVQDDTTANVGTWLRQYKYDDAGNRIAEYTPSSLSGYTAGNGTTAPSITEESSGLVYVFDFNDDNRLIEREIKEGDPNFDVNDSCTDCTLIEEIEYPSADSGNERRHLPTSIQRYQSASSSNADDIEKIEFLYEFHGASVDDDDIEWIETKVEAEADDTSTEDEYGPGGHFYTHEFFDTQGRNYWSRTADNVLTRREFHVGTGLPTQIERNADSPVAGTEFLAGDLPGSLPTDVHFDGRNSDGDSLTTEIVYDLLGRVQQTTSPGGVHTYIRREMRDSPDRDGIEYYAEIRLPHELSAGSEYNGPATITWRNADNDVIATQDCEVEAAYTFYTATSGYTWPISIYDLDEDAVDLLTRSAVTHDLSGLVKETTVWHDVDAGALEPEKYVSEFTYDALGRLLHSKNPNGTYQSFTYDVLDRVTAAGIGTDPDDQTGDMVTTQQLIYDGASGTSTQGVGNGNLTRVVESEDATDRITDYFYDFRDRQTGVVRPEKPYASATAYDNLDRVTEEALFAPSSAPSSPPAADSETNRSQYRDIFYSQRGRVYSVKTAIDPSQGSPTYLEVRRWFDEVGRPVGEWGPNTPRRKMTYDGLGRVETSYVTDGSDNGASTFDDDYDDVYSTSTHEAVVSDDVVLQQTVFDYIDEQNLLALTTQYLRTHDNDTVAGALSAFTGQDAKKVITSYFGFEYDTADRVVSEINFGTRKTNFEYGGTAPANDSADPRTWTTVGADLEVETTYDKRGLVESVTDSRGQITNYFYDDLNRAIAVVEAAEDDAGKVSATDIDWDNTNLRWKITGGLDDTELDKDRVTTFAYDGIGNMTQRVLHVPSDTSAPEEDSGLTQVTEYMYVVTDSDSPHPSELNSNDLLREVKYPDGDSVLHAYNQLGEVITIEDQRGVVHEYERDLLGRVTLDKATTIPSGEADDWIKSIGIAFDNAGRVHEVTSYAGVTTGSTIRNQVEFTYETTWDINEVWQDHLGAVDGSTPKVAYSYASSESRNHYRQSEVEGVNSAGWTVEYGTADGLDDLISRVVKLEDDMVSPSAFDVGVEYDHIGVTMLAVADLYEVDVQLDYTTSHTGERNFGTKTENAGIYPGFDRFGRVLRHTWVDGDFTIHGSSSAVSNIPAIVERLYNYDEDSNRTASFDRRQGAQQNQSNKYTYDDLDRLTHATRGSGYELVTTFAFTADSGGENWSLDMLGNWDQIITDDTAPYGTFDDMGPNVDSFVKRDHDDAINELTELDTDATDPGDISYDDAGNIDDHEFPDADVDQDFLFRYTHDAWNRLVKVEYVDVDNVMQSETAETRGEYEYNGLHHRIKRRTDTDLDGMLDQRRDMYYTADWQIIDEDVWDSWSSGSPGSIDRNINYLWGLRGIDDLVVRRTDTDGDGAFDFVLAPAEEVDYYYHLDDVQGTTVAQLDEAAEVVERNSYTAYGVAQHHPKYDVDADGDRDGSDRSIVSSLAGVRKFPVDPTLITEAGYRAEADLDRDGDVDTADLNLYDGLSSDSGINAGELSPVTGMTPTDNILGYHGYCFNNETQQYAVRYRCYDPQLGRFITRDPAGYGDGASLYEFVRSSPVVAIDPLGLGLLKLLYAGDWNASDEEYRAAIRGFQESSRSRVEKKLLGIHRTVQEAKVLTQNRVGMMGDEEAFRKSALMQAATEIALADSSASTGDIALIMAGGSMAGFGENVADTAEGVCRGDAEAIGDAFDLTGEGLLALAGLRAGYMPDAKAFQLFRPAAVPAPTRPSADTIPEGQRLSTYRQTQPNETFIRYETGDPEFSRVSADRGLAPGTYAAPSSEGMLPRPLLNSRYNLPYPDVPRTRAFIVSPSEGTWIVGPRPVIGGSGAEVFFPFGTSPGTVGNLIPTIP